VSVRSGAGVEAWIDDLLDRRRAVTAPA
jgi:hypothetical protein